MYSCNRSALRRGGKEYRLKDRQITTVAKTLLITLNVGLFAWVWTDFYNSFAFRTHRPEGAVGSIIVYFILYLWLTKLYRGYAIASSSVEETALSQFISFGIADLTLYIAANLLRRNYVDVWPGAGIVVLQLVGSTLIVYLTRRYMLTHIRPASTLLVYGASTQPSEAEQFTARLCRKYRHLFAVNTLLPDDDQAEVDAAIDGCEAVIFLGVDANRRARYMERCLELRRTFFFVPEFADIICRGCSVKNFLDTPLMRYDYNYDRRRVWAAKRLCDIVFSALFLIVLSPVMLLVAVAIKIEDRGPVFYRQERVTLDGKTFNIWKFRSMVVDAEKYGAIPATEHDPRITKVGAIIRKSRLDETPQLINILLGHMSFVGPRPERILHVALYEQQVPEFKYRLRVKGGLTGYAQVYGKYNTTPEDKLKLDMLYIENQSLLLDFKLALLTIKIMFSPESTEGFEESRSQEINRSDNEQAG